MNELSAAPILTAPSDVDPPEQTFDDNNDSGDGQPIHWVTVARFYNCDDAHIARLRLNAEGIPCFIADEHMVGTAWHYAIALGGAKVKVPIERAKEAAEALAGTRPTAADERANQAGICPRCGSAQIRGGHKVRRFICLLAIGAAVPVFALPVLFLGIAYLLISRTSACDECGYEWKTSPARGFDVVTSVTPTQAPEQSETPDRSAEDSG
jgi:hypothetical protein